MPKAKTTPLLPDDCLVLAAKIKVNGSKFSIRDALIVGMASRLAMAPGDFKSFSVSANRQMIDVCLTAEMQDHLAEQVAVNGDSPFAAIKPQHISKIICTAADECGYEDVTGLSPKIGTIIQCWKDGEKRSAIAAKFGFTVDSVNNILKNKRRRESV